MRIDQACADFAMAKKFAHCYEIYSIFDELSREAMAQKVKVKVDSSSLPDLADRPPE